MLKDSVCPVECFVYFLFYTLMCDIVAAKGRSLRTSSQYKEHCTISMLLLPVILRSWKDWASLRWELIYNENLFSFISEIVLDFFLLFLTLNASRFLGEFKTSSS